MLPFLLLLTGAAVSLYCLWQLRRWIGDPAGDTAVVRRLETLVDELVATAETTATMVAEKAEALSRKMAEADETLARLEAASRAEPVMPAVRAVPRPAAEPAAAGPAVPGAPPGARGEASGKLDTHRQVYALADAGMDVTGIAKRLSITKGEVQLILGLRQSR